MLFEGDTALRVASEPALSAFPDGVEPLLSVPLILRPVVFTSGSAVLLLVLLLFCVADPAPSEATVRLPPSVVLPLTLFDTGEEVVLTLRPVATPEVELKPPPPTAMARSLSTIRRGP